VSQPNRSLQPMRAALVSDAGSFVEWLVGQTGKPLQRGEERNPDGQSRDRSSILAEPPGVVAIPDKPDNGEGELRSARNRLLGEMRWSFRV
jgi:hypothetical protein